LNVLATKLLEPVLSQLYICLDAGFKLNNLLPNFVGKRSKRSRGKLTEEVNVVKIAPLL